MRLLDRARGWLTGALTAADPGENRVYLTYDDGPDPEVTPKLLSLLDAAQARATFFVLHSEEPWWKGLLRDIAVAGHTVALHGMTHRSAYLLGNAGIHADLRRLADAIAAAGVEPCMLFRPPFGDVRPDTVWYLRARGIRSVLWTRLPGDFRPRDGDRLLRRALKGFRPGDILALHDGTKLRPAPALDLTARLFDQIKERGWRAEALE